MKNTKTVLLLLFVLNLQLSHAQGKDGLLAVPYPGAISEPPDKWSESRSRTFYTKDPVEKVKAHYTKILGEFVPWPQDNTAYFRETIPSNDVGDILAKRGVDLGESRAFAGVTLFGKSGNSNNTMEKVFDKLKGAYLLRFANAEAEDVSAITKHLEDAELKQTLSRYEHLSWEHFPAVKEKHTDDVIFEKYFTAPAEARMKELADVQKKYADAMAKMKYDEAGKLGDRMVKLSGMQSNPKEDWDTAIKCLQEMEKNAYATKIVIDKHPSLWDLSDGDKK